ncbi:RNA-guided endonuclease TnpB family protein [Gloeocapsopsis dulcis]|uniref:RNA-guided endonuclease TnpB family protein n=1 Tax=Gloeocapsopsis dulcis TaxID=2859516 RepID=UPI0018C6441D|nr:RNA-guided endonuclease TnpB family protein [Gloeocapsopsis dulcis]
MQRLSGRERRYQTWLNHNIISELIIEAKDNNCSVAIEDLTGIRRRTNEQPRNKTERRRSNSWAFHQLRIFLEYKGIKEGVKVITVPPAYTSQTCNCCLHIGVRTEKKFKCINSNCGWIGDADTNGSKVIALLGETYVNSPRGSWLSCPLGEAAGGLLKASTSA